MPYFFEDEYALYGSDRVQSALQRWRPDAWTTFTSAADETFSQYNTIGWMTSVLPELVAEDDTARQLEDSELLDLARRAVESLPTAYRTVIEMRDWLGMDYASIAVELGVPVGTVRSRLSRARDHVRAVVRPALLDRCASNADGSHLSCPS